MRCQNRKMKGNDAFRVGGMESYIRRLKLMTNFRKFIKKDMILYVSLAYGRVDMFRRLFLGVVGR